MLEVLTVAKRKQHQMAKRLIGRYIVADPEICHGQPTFRGTRILVADVMEQVAGGVAWETIVEEWRGDVAPDAIAEAVRLASQAFRDHSACASNGKLHSSPATRISTCRRSAIDDIAWL